MKTSPHPIQKSKIFTSVVLILFSLPAIADYGRVCWDAPTEREDGTPLATDEISHYKVYWSDKEEANYTHTEETTDTCFNVPALSDTKRWVVSTVFDTSGRESQFSDKQVIDIGKKPPRALSMHPVEMIKESAQ